MKAKVLLLVNVKGLGNAKSIVSVSRGYALNYLVPKGYAKLVDEKSFESAKGLEKNVENRKEESAKREKEILESKVLTFKTKVGDGEKLFGSITSSDIADKIKKVFNIDIDKKKIKLEVPIKKAEVYFVTVKLHKEIQAQIEVHVEKE
ncbi:MAG: 50S ribosomal protein L9 [Caldiserica bacterium]|jgi:large subunit ribosomal protein L9|nr:50S ribosomal protein L9 [Caldisericota bacterium]